MGQEQVAITLGDGDAAAGQNGTRVEQVLELGEVALLRARWQLKRDGERVGHLGHEKADRSALVGDETDRPGYPLDDPRALREGLAREKGGHGLQRSEVDLRAIDRLVLLERGRGGEVDVGPGRPIDIALATTAQGRQRTQSGALKSGHEIPHRLWSKSGPSAPFRNSRCYWTRGASPPFYVGPVGPRRSVCLWDRFDASGDSVFQIDVGGSGRHRLTQAGLKLSQV